MKAVFIFIAIFAALSLSASAQPLADLGPYFLEEHGLPLAWKTVETIEVPDVNLPSFSQKLKGEIVALENQIIDVGGIRLQINTVECANRAEAEKVYETLVSMSGNPRNYLVRDNTVFEYICNNGFVIQKAMSIFSPQVSRTAKWDVVLMMAPIRDADYMKWNEMFNHLKSYRADSDNPVIASKIKNLRPSFEFDSTITLFYETENWNNIHFNIFGSAEADRVAEDIIAFRYQKPMDILGIPFTQMGLTAWSKSFGIYKPEYAVNYPKLTEATEFWPFDKPEIQAIVQNTVNDDMNDREKAERLLKWVNDNIEFEGQTIGSRYGVMDVLEQGFGHCWDHADVYITLCRAAGIPARQIMGWLYRQEGHIWCEVYLRDIGWVPVDATASWLGVSIEYIPLVLSEDGAMPFIYWDIPEIKLMGR